MRIKDVTYEQILFDNGSCITFDHMRDCCESNFADFYQIENEAMETDFCEELIFEEVEGSGFRFGSKGTHMFFIPCYSHQNGYYSSHVDIYFNYEHVLLVEAEFG